MKFWWIQFSIFVSFSNFLKRIFGMFFWLFTCHKTLKVCTIMQDFPKPQRLYTQNPKTEHRFHCFSLHCDGGGWTFLKKNRFTILPGFSPKAHLDVRGETTNSLSTFVYLEHRQARVCGPCRCGSTSYACRTGCSLRPWRIGRSLGNMWRVLGLEGVDESAFYRFWRGEGLANWYTVRHAPSIFPGGEGAGL